MAVKDFLERSFQCFGGFSLMSKFVSVCGGFAFFVYILILGWQSLGPEKVVPNADRQKVAKQAVEKIIGEIRTCRGSLRNVTMLHFRNDTTNYFSDHLRDRINFSGILFLNEEFFMDRVRKKLNLRLPAASSVKEAADAAPKTSEAVLWGNLDSFESSGEGAIIQGEWFLICRKSGRILYSGKIREDNTSRLRKKLSGALQSAGGKTSKETELIRYTASLVPWYIRFLGFVLMVLLLPVITIGFIRVMLAKKSNGINAFVLGLYTLIDAILAFFMIGGAFSEIGTILFCAATALAFCYNVSLMKFALRLGEN